METPSIRWTKSELIIEIGQLHEIIDSYKKEIISCNRDRLTIQKLKKENEALHKLVKKQKEEIGAFRTEAAEVEKLKNELKVNLKLYQPPVWNARGAGRKPKLTDEMKERIKNYRKTGMTIKEIAETLQISIGLAHKGCKS